MPETNARMMTSPLVTSAFLVRSFVQGVFSEPLDATMTVDVMAEKVATVNAGDMTEVVSMLISGAVALEAVATQYLQRGRLAIDNPEVADTYTRLGLKAQAQSRANLEALIELKNPRPVFAKQTNIAAGPQQVNNGALPPPGPDALSSMAQPPTQVDQSRGESQLPPSKLLEGALAERLD